MDLAAQRLCHALSPALWGFPAVAAAPLDPAVSMIVHGTFMYLNLTFMN